MKNTGKLLIAVFMAVLMLPAVLAVSIPGLAASGAENRTLAEFPDIRATGFADWTRDFDTFLKDHLPFKGFSTKLYSFTMLRLFHESSSSHVVVGKNGWFLYNGYNIDNPIADLTGINMFSVEEEDNICHRITAFEQDHTDTSFVLILAPNKESIYTDLFPNSFSRYFAAQTRAEHLKEYLSGKTDAFCFPVSELRAERQAGRQTYYKYDTHWNQIGAYIGLKAACEKVHVALPLLDKTMIRVENGQPVRDLAALSNSTDLCMDDLMYSIVPYENVSVEASEKENLFDQSFAYLRRFSSDAPNGQTLLLVGDSFSEVMVDVAARCFVKVIFIRRDTGHVEEIHALTENLIAQNPGCIVLMEVVERGAWWLKYSDYLF